MSQQLADDGVTSCVEHGAWTPVPVGPSANLEQFTLRLGDVDAAEDERIAKSGMMTFHAVGCAGDYSDHTPQMAVAAGMAAQAKDAGSAGRPGSPAVSASFFYHLGDVVYMDEDKSNPARNEQSQMYNDQFYAPHTQYGRSIFAIAGNHDGKMHATGMPRRTASLSHSQTDRSGENGFSLTGGGNPKTRPTTDFLFHYARYPRNTQSVCGFNSAGFSTLATTFTGPHSDWATNR
jgi:Calcineurin-like phosphoesterase